MCLAFSSSLLSKFGEIANWKRVRTRQNLLKRHVIDEPRTRWRNINKTSRGPIVRMQRTRAAVIAGTSSLWTCTVAHREVGNLIGGASVHFFTKVLFGVCTLLVRKLERRDEPDLSMGLMSGPFTRARSCSSVKVDLLRLARLFVSA